MTNIYIPEDQYDDIVQQRNGFIIKPINPISVLLKPGMEVFVTYANKHRTGVRAIVGPISKGASLKQLLHNTHESIYPHQCDIKDKEEFYTGRYAAINPRSVGWIMLHVVLF